MRIARATFVVFLAGIWQATALGQSSAAIAVQPGGSRFGGPNNSTPNQGATTSSGSISAINIGGPRGNASVNLAPVDPTMFRIDSGVRIQTDFLAPLGITIHGSGVAVPECVDQDCVTISPATGSNGTE